MIPDVHASFGQWVVYEFRANRGRLAAPFSSRDLILLTTLEPATGLPRTAPARLVPDPAAVLISAFGPAEHAGWYQDLLVFPWALVERGADAYQARAVPVPGGPSPGHGRWRLDPDPGRAVPPDSDPRVLSLSFYHDLLRHPGPADGGPPAEPPDAAENPADRAPECDDGRSPERFRNPGDALKH